MSDVTKIKNILLQELGRIKLPEDDVYNLVANDTLLKLKKKLTKVNRQEDIMLILQEFFIYDIEFVNRTKISEEMNVLSQKLRPLGGAIVQKFFYHADKNPSLINGFHLIADVEEYLLRFFVKEKINFSKINNLLNDNTFRLLTPLLYEAYMQKVCLDNGTNKEIISEQSIEIVYNNLVEYFKIILISPDFENQNENQIQGVYQKNNIILNQIIEAISKVINEIEKELNATNRTRSIDATESSLLLMNQRLEETLNEYLNKQQQLDYQTFKNLLQPKINEKNDSIELYFDKTRLKYYSDIIGLNLLLEKLNHDMMTHKKIFTCEDFSLSLDTKRKGSEFIQVKLNKKLSVGERDYILEKINSDISLAFKAYEKPFVVRKLEDEYSKLFKNLSTIVREYNLCKQLNYAEKENKVRKKL